MVVYIPVLSQKAIFYMIFIEDALSVPTEM